MKMIAKISNVVLAFRTFLRLIEAAGVSTQVLAIGYLLLDSADQSARYDANYIPTMSDGDELEGFGWYGGDELSDINRDAARERHYRAELVRRLGMIVGGMSRVHEALDGMSFANNGDDMVNFGGSSEGFGWYGSWTRGRTVEVKLDPGYGPVFVVETGKIGQPVAASKFLGPLLKDYAFSLGALA